MPVDPPERWAIATQWVSPSARRLPKARCLPEVSRCPSRLGQARPPIPTPASLASVGDVLLAIRSGKLDAECGPTAGGFTNADGATVGGHDRRRDAEAK